MFSQSLLFLLATAALSNARALEARVVDSLNEEATAEAHVRDNGATRAFSDIQIKTSEGKCLFVDPLSGDFRANLTPVQIADCGSTGGQGWDIISSGLHNDQAGNVLVVSTTTQACLNVDLRRRVGDQVNLFSCGGRAAGEGIVTDSQLFAFDGSATLSLAVKNGDGCLTGSGAAVSVAGCSNGGDQIFTFGDAAPAAPAPVEEAPVEEAPVEQAPVEEAPAPAPVVDAPAPVVTAPPTGAPASSNPREAVPVSRAGGILQPEAAEESHQFDDTAERARENVSIRSNDGRCLSIDPTAGDFRQNLIPVAVVACADTPNQKFDIITRGRHNNGNDGKALIVSSLTEGCISFDARRPAGDTVTLFSCGGRAGGEGETDFAQLYPFDGSNSIVLQPASGQDQFCLVAGGERLDSGACSGDNSQVFTLA